MALQALDDNGTNLSLVWTFDLARPGGLCQAAEGSKQVTPAKPAWPPRQPALTTARPPSVVTWQPLTRNHCQRHQLWVEEEGILPNDLVKDRFSPFGGKNSNYLAGRMPAETSQYMLLLQIANVSLSFPVFKEMLR